KANIIYQTNLLNDLLGSSSYVAEAKVSDYIQFGTDLKQLKNLYNNFFDTQEYHKMFITSKENQRKYEETRDAKLLCEFDKFLKDKKKHEDSFYTKLTSNLKKLHKRMESNETRVIIDEVLEKLE